MPLFTAIAGWAYALKPFSASSGFGSFVRKKALRLLVPMAAVGTLYFLVQYLMGSVVILGGLSLVNSLHAYTFASLKRKKLISTTPLNDALNALILALNASAAAFVLLFTKKFRILS